MIKLKNLITEGQKHNLALEYMKNLIKGTEWENNIYLAGGAVRDELMGTEVKDLDMVADKPNGGIDFANWSTQKMGNFKDGSNPVTYPTYGTAKFNLRNIIYKGQDLSEIDIETVMPRAEQYEPGSRKPSVAGASLKADAERRDLTANSLFKNISTGEILDLTGRGMDDLKSGVARTPLDPDVTFQDDPLRMLRQVRFFSKYNWKIPLEQLKSLKRNAPHLKNISMERVQEEFTKILKTDRAAKALKLLKMVGLLKEMMPEVKLTDEKLEAIKNAKDVETKMSILFNDIDKNQIEVILKRLKYPNEVVSHIAKSVALLSFFDNGVDDKKIRQFKRVSGERADTVLKTIDALNKPIDIDLIRDKMNSLQSGKPPITGNDLIRMGIKPGHIFKTILDTAQEMYDEDPETPKQRYL